MKSGEVKLFVGILVVAVILVAIAVYPVIANGRRGDGASPPGTVTYDRKTLLPEGVPVRGPRDAPYLLVEVGDYQCPQCKLADTAVAKLVGEYPKKLEAAFIHMQATQTHTNARVLARAAAAAQLQGKFWPMHAAIYSKQAEFAGATSTAVTDAIMKIAAGLKLDMLKFRNDMQSKAAEETVERQETLAQKLGVFGTPTFFLVRPGAETMRFSNLGQMTAYMEDPANLK
ncbi:MAG: thioredoxin domain-containing protein [Chthonomonadales bacterium]|nr:thioredoxin domain-containing protein [Chthonomonadales bacterium]